MDIKGWFKKVDPRAKDVDAIIKQVHNAVEQLNEVRLIHEETIISQQKAVDEANLRISESTKQVSRAESAIAKIKELMNI